MSKLKKELSRLIHTMKLLTRLLGSLLVAGTVGAIALPAKAAQTTFTFNERIGEFYIGTATLRSDRSRLYFSLPVGVPACDRFSGLNAWVKFTWRGTNGSWYSQTEPFDVGDEGAQRTITGSYRGYFPNLAGEANVETFAECIPLNW